MSSAKRTKSLLPELAEEGSELVPFQWDIAYGDKSAARPGMVMIRWSRGGVVMAEEYLPVAEFLSLARGFSNVAAALEYSENKPMPADT